MILIEYLAIFKVYLDLTWEAVRDPNNNPIARMLSLIAKDLLDR